MPDSAENLRPVQVFLDTKQFIDLEEPRDFGGGGKDFFGSDDEGFGRHKQRISKRFQSLSRSMKERHEAANFLHVLMREDALAKSYRPVGSLFTRSHGFALVGAGQIGEMIFQCTPRALGRLDRYIEAKAELEPRQVKNQRTGKFELRPSTCRCELGAIADVTLHDAADRVEFSGEFAVSWLSQPNVLGGYIIELFRPDPRVARQAVAKLLENFKQGIQEISGGIVVRPFLPSAQTASFGVPPLALSIQLTSDTGRRQILLPFLDDGRLAEASGEPRFRSISATERDLSPARHQILLDFLREQSIVRSVELPPIIEAAPFIGTPSPELGFFPAPTEGVNYPVVGIIDGGIANVSPLTDWCAGSAGIVPPEDREEAHGTFIAGLVCGGAALNPHIANGLEPSGCKFYDLDIFPRRDLRPQHYEDIEYFFDLLDESIKSANNEYGVRVFNLSFGLRRPMARFAYSPLADRLDRIARLNDIVLVISAGNLAAGSARPPWPTKASDALAMLANFGAGDHRITPPAEHLLGLTIGSVNPPGIGEHQSGLPTTYTRRGPGVGGARKPDLAHFGGVEPSAKTGNRTGLVSLDPEGEVIENCGTSFAAPNTAANIATLDRRLGGAAPRETLLALPVHRAERAKPLIPTVINQNPCAQFRRPMDMIFQG